MQVKISLPPELVKALDEERGDVSRSVFYRRRLEMVSGPDVARALSRSVGLTLEAELAARQGLDLSGGVEAQVDALSAGVVAEPADSSPAIPVHATSFPPISEPPAPVAPRVSGRRVSARPIVQKRGK